MACVLELCRGVRRVALGVRGLFFFSSRRRHTRFDCDWSSDVCSSDLAGNVNAAQSGAWNVGVTSLPAVQLAPGTTIAVGGGSLAVEDPARRAFAVTLCATYLDDCGNTPSVASFPISTRFVIEYAAGICSVRNTGIHGWELKARLNGQDNLYQVSDKLSAHDDETTTGLFSNPMRVYVDGGVPNGLSVDLLDAGFSESHDLGPFAYCTVTLSGHLVDMPATFPTAP